MTRSAASAGALVSFDSMVCRPFPVAFSFWCVLNGSPGFGRVLSPPRSESKIVFLPPQIVISFFFRIGGALFRAAHGLGDVAERRSVAAAVGL
jgi:hypothetical protein